MKAPIEIDFNGEYKHVNILYGLLVVSWYDAMALTTVCGKTIYKRLGALKRLFGVTYV